MSQREKELQSVRDTYAQKGKTSASLEMSTVDCLFWEENGFLIEKQELSPNLGRAIYKVTWEKPERPYCIASSFLKETLMNLFNQLQATASDRQKEELSKQIKKLFHNFPVAERHEILPYLNRLHV